MTVLLSDSPLQPMRRAELSVGQALPYHVYDAEGRLLLAAGNTVDDPGALEALLSRGLYRKLVRLPKVSASAAAEEEARPPKAAASAPRSASPESRGKRRHKRPASRYLQMWIAGGSSDQAMTVVLIGMHDPHSMVITAPRNAEGTLAFVKEGADYEFRGFSGELVYKFRAAVLKARFEPYPYLHVGWPQDWAVEKRRVRSARRVGCEIPCIVYPRSGEEGGFVHGHVIDLSTGGAGIRLARGLPEHCARVRIALRVEVAESSHLLELEAKVVHGGHGGHGGHGSHGSHGGHGGHGDAGPAVRPAVGRAAAEAEGFGSATLLVVDAEPAAASGGEPLRSPGHDPDGVKLAVSFIEPGPQERLVLAAYTALAYIRETETPLYAA